MSVQTLPTLDQYGKMSLLELKAALEALPLDAPDFDAHIEQIELCIQKFAQQIEAIRKAKRQAAAVTIYTDGGCITQSSLGSWAAILTATGSDGKVVTRELSGCAESTTSNRMEMIAVIQALKALKSDGCIVKIVCDSQLVVNTMTKGWKRNANQDLWAELDTLVSKHHITWEWIRGHAGHSMNEQVHKLVVEARGGWED